MNRGPSPAELDALTAWWKAQRHIGKAAKVLVRSRQRVANNLMSFRRLEGATDNVELALKYLDVIEQRWPDVLKRTSQIDRFAEVVQRSVSANRAYRVAYTVPTTTAHNRSVLGTWPHTGTFDSTPTAVVSPPRTYVTGGAESGESWVKAGGHVEAAKAARLQLGRFLTGQHRIPHMLVVAEHGVVIEQRHALMVAA